MSATNSKRIVWIDLVRIYAIACIILTHTVQTAMPVSQSVALLMVIGSAALFFMASGALVLPLDKPAWPWLKHRFMAVGVPMLIWGVFYAFIYEYFDPGHYRGTPLWTRLASVFVAQRGSMWFLDALLGLYLLVPLISPWIRQASRRQVELLLLVWMATGLYSFANLFFGIGLGQPPHLSIIGGLYGFFGYFVMGYYFRNWPLRRQSTRHILLVVGTLLAFSAVGAVFYGVALRNDVGYAMLDDLGANNMGWFSLVFALFSMIPAVSDRTGRIISFFAKGVFGAFLSMDFVINCLVHPHISSPIAGAAAAIALCFGIGLALRHIPVIGKYLC